MADVYDRAKALAARLLAPRSKGGKGLEITITRTTRGAYNPATGSTSGDIVQEFDTSAFRDTYRQDDIDGTLILVTDVKLLISPVQLDGDDLPPPAVGDSVDFSGTVYRVHNVVPWSYAGLAVGYEVQGRL